MHVGFIGLGNMGQPMATNVLRAGHTVTVYNRTLSRAEAITGAQVASSPADAAASSDVVITMLADDTACKEVVLGEEGLTAGLRPGAAHVSMSTISVSLAERLTEIHAERGQAFISAPVFGRPEAAQAAKLFVVIAGSIEQVRRLHVIFDVVGQRTFYIGERPSMANAVKLTGNFLIASNDREPRGSICTRQKARHSAEHFPRCSDQFPI